MIKVAADKYLFELEEMVPKEVDLHLYDPGKGFPGNLGEIKALLIRTVTPINSDTLPKLPDSLSFIGTGSAGIDHIDQEILNKRGINVSNAAGCNARSVAEFVCTTLLFWASQKEISLRKKSIGIVGVGNVGSELNSMLQKLGIVTICYDPPKEDRDTEFKSSTIDEVLDTDIITFHTPLIKSGNYPTYHWLDEKKLTHYQFDLVINTARGGVIDESALLDAKFNGRVGDFIIDVWENEPVFNDEIAQNAYLFTPHIAGYSIQAKQRATSMIVEAMCQYFSIPYTHPTFNNNRTNIPEINTSTYSLAEVLLNIHPFKKYQEKLATLIGKPPQEKGRGFNRLRAQFPLRNEYQFLTIDQHIIDAYPVLNKLGISAK
ncbi:MAG: 4-phosphoerythronate dehydrogenase [Balneolaceae bacterium]|nr:4-phosphoerythronate dehydrogenase [Balneolaceae bacterium]